MDNFFLNALTLPSFASKFVDTLKYYFSDELKIAKRNSFTDTVQAKDLSG